VTRAEIRLRAAQKRKAIAQQRMSCAYEKRRMAIEKVSKETLPALWAAEKAFREAKIAETVALLAVAGITPMQTIVMWKNKRWAVDVTREGLDVLVPVGKHGRPMMHLNAKPAPYRLREVTATSETVQA
jgi:hypothetical protein